MASHQVLTFMLSLMLFLVTISFPESFSISIADDKKSNNSIHGAALIEKTCKNTDFYDICVSSFKSDPESFKADVLGLLRISIDLANVNATGIFSYIDNLIKSSKDVGASVKWCLKDYQSSMYDRDRGIEALSRGDYFSVNEFVGAAYGDIDDCKLEFTMALSAISSSIGFEELPSELMQMNEIMLTLDHISLQILCRNLMTCNGPFPPPPAAPTPSF